MARGIGLTNEEIVLAVAALDTAADALMAGVEAAKRLDYPLDKSVAETAQKMRAFREKLMRAA